MKLVSWSCIGRYLTSLKKIEALRVEPKSIIDRTEGSEYAKFFYLYRGKGVYKFADGSRMTILPGMFVYVPQNEKVTEEWEKGSYLCFIDFLLEDVETGEFLNFEEKTKILFTQPPEHICELVDLIGSFYPSAARCTYLRCQKMFFELLYELSLLVPNTWLPDGYNHKLTKALNYIRGNYYKDFTIGDLAEYSEYSASRLRSAIRALTGKSPIEFRNQLRIEKACEYLSSTNISISEIAAMVGFKEPFYFTNCFKKYMGVSPSAYRRKTSR